MRPCARFAHQVDDYVTGRCGDEVARWMAAHLATCARCRAQASAARAACLGMRATLQSARDGVSPDDPVFLSKLHRRLASGASERAASPPPRPPSSRWRTAHARPLAYGLGLAAVGAILVHLYAGLTPMPMNPAHPVPPRPPVEIPIASGEARGSQLAARGVETPPTHHRNFPYQEPRAKSQEPRAKSQEPRARAGVPAARWPQSGQRRGRARTGDLEHFNLAPATALAGWARMPRDEMQLLTAGLDRAAAGGDDFVFVPPPRIAAEGADADRAAATALMAYQEEKAVVDSRLFRKVTLAFKATALSDLCERLRADTGIALEAGRSVADEKVTLFCRDTPLRDVMRQLSRPFGYTWLRSGKQGAYRYELAQDLRSQLLEEELRNRDRNAALLALDQEMAPYRRYLGLSPAELRAHTAPAAQGTRPSDPSKLPAHFAGTGWGPLQLYFGLSPQDLEALRSGQRLAFSANPQPGERPLPRDLARGVLQSVPDRRILRRGDQFDVGPAERLPEGLPPAEVPEASPVVTLSIDATELGQLTLRGASGFRIETPNTQMALLGDDGPIAIGVSPTVGAPKNRDTNAKLARDPGLRTRVSITPKPSCPPAGSVNPSLQPPPRDGEGERRPSPDREGAGREVGPRVTTADVLEALHRATGMNLVADYYTRLYPPTVGTVREQPLFEALNQIADAMRLQWKKDGSWLQLRSASFFHDRLKEVPNRLLTRWTASRRQHGALTLDDLVEIGQLSDAQLDSEVMAEGARVCYGLTEWELGRNGMLRPNWRYLATLTPGQRQEATREAGLALRQMLLPQQQQFLQLSLSRGGAPGRGGDADVGMVDLAHASLRVVYTLPGEWEWRPPQRERGGREEREIRVRAIRGAPPARPRRADAPLEPSPVRARTREAALEAARRIDPSATEAQIVPSELAVTMVYALGGPDARLSPFIIRADPHNTLARPASPVEP